MAERLRSMGVRQPYQFDPTKVYHRGSWEEYFQLKEARERGIDLENARRTTKEAQMEAMHAVVADLPDDICRAAATKLGFLQVNISPKVASDEVAREAQPIEMKKKGTEVATDDKGKGVAIDISTDDDDDDDWGDDELIYDGISD